MTSEQEPQEERRVPTDEERQATRRNTYRALGDGLMIRASQFLGTFAASDLHPALLGEWARLATELHARADTDELAEHRKKYLESITRADE